MTGRASSNRVRRCKECGQLPWLDNGEWHTCSHVIPNRVMTDDPEEMW